MAKRESRPNLELINMNQNQEEIKLDQAVEVIENFTGSNKENPSENPHMIEEMKDNLIMNKSCVIAPDLQQLGNQCNQNVLFNSFDLHH